MSELKYIFLDDNIDLSELDFKDDNNKDSERLQWFARRHAHDHHKRNLGLTYVIQHNNENIGYFTLAASSIHKRDTNKTSPVTSQLPSIILVYFAVDRPYRKNKKGIKVGTDALMWMFALARKVAQNIGCRYIILYAKNAIQFYEKNGFLRTETKSGDFVLMYKDLYPDKIS